MDRRTRLRWLFRRDQSEQDLDDEIRAHLDIETDENIEFGMPPQEARYVARRAFGNVTSTKESTREVWIFRCCETFLQDLRYGVRQLKKSRGFTAVAVLSLALGIAGTSTIFSVLYTIVLHPLPFKNPDQLVTVWESHSESGQIREPTGGTIFGWRQAFEQIAVATPAANPDTKLIAGEATRARGQHVSAHLFQMLGVEPFLGRTFVPEDVRQGYSERVVISYDFWRTAFGADPAVIGKTFRNPQGGVRTVIGVMPQGFWVTPWTSGIDYWRAKPNFKPSSSQRGWWDVMARLKPGTGIEQVRAELNTISRRLATVDPAANSGWVTRVEPAHRMFGFGSLVTGETPPRYAQALYVLLGASGFLLLIACTNVASLLMGRAATRQPEIATRVALGAGRFRVTRQLLTESLLLSAMGGLAGVLLARGGVQIFVLAAPNWHPYMDQVRVDYRVVGFSLVISLLTGILFGLVPAIRASAPSLTGYLKEGAKHVSGGSRQRGGNLLVVAEVAMAIVLLIGAALLLNSFVRLVKAPLGFNPTGLLTMRISLPWANPKYSPRQGRFVTITPQTTMFYEQVLEKVRALPGISSAGMISRIPTENNEFYRRSFLIVGRENLVEGEVQCDYHEVSGDFFETMQIPLFEGRHFNARDVYDSRWVVIISETLARRYFAGESPIGRHIRPSLMRWWENATAETIAQISDDNRPREIVGVVGDVRQDIRSEPIPVLYVPYRQHPSEYNLWRGSHTLTLEKDLVIRTAGDPTNLAPAARKAVSDVDPEQVPFGVKTMQERLSESVGSEWFWLQLLGIFAGLALFLAGVGLYGVISYSVAHRTHEFGIRMALGASTAKVRTQVMMGGLMLSLVGVVLGILAAAGLTRFIESQLYGVTANDPVTYVAVSFVLVGVALLASYVPARRATKIDPIVALRHE